jgi:hypothetical protein
MCNNPLYGLIILPISYYKRGFVLVFCVWNQALSLVSRLGRRDVRVAKGDGL